MENIEKRLGFIVKRLRQKSGMTQERLAQLLTAGGIPTKQNTVAKLEGGLRPTSVAEFGALASVFGITATELAEAVFPREYHEPDLLISTALEADEAQAKLIDLRARVGGLQRDLAEAMQELMVSEQVYALLRDRLTHLRQTTAGEIHGVDSEAP